MSSLYLSIKLACLHVEVVDTSGATVANWTQPLFVYSRRAIESLLLLVSGL